MYLWVTKRDSIYPTTEFWSIVPYTLVGVVAFGLLVFGGEKLVRKLLSNKQADSQSFPGDSPS
jgi:hypothetical protein